MVPYNSGHKINVNKPNTDRKRRHLFMSFFNVNHRNNILQNVTFK